MLRIAICLLLACGYAYAGEVKTFDGSKVDKDSVATLKVYAQIGKEHQPKTIFVFAVRVDEVRLYERTLPGEDFTDAHLNKEQRYFNAMLVDAEIADRLDKIRLLGSTHTVVIQCILRYNQKMTGEFGYWREVPLEFKPLPGHKYEVRASCEDDKWTIWIQDRKTKEVVSTATEVI